MHISDIKRVVDQVSRDKGIDREVLIKALEEALKSAARKKFGNKMDIEVNYNEESGEIEVFQFKDVAAEVTEPALEISLEEGRKLDPECEIGDSLGTKMDTSTFGRIAAQSAKQVIIQKMKDAEKDAVFSSYIDRKGEVINGIVQRLDRGDIIVNLGHTEGIVPVKEQVPRESYRRGDRIRAYILDVLHETRGPQIILSRTHPNFLIHLFRTEVPEITEGIVNIMGAAREPGIRAKIAVVSNNSDIDPVGACVGMKGSRVQNVVQELRGEKIDIISWHPDPHKFVCNALAPAEISRVIVDETNQSMEVIVPDEFLSIAIGKKGQNVRLASKLSGWHLDVKSETRYSKAMKSGYDSLVALPGVGISMADALYEEGFYSAEEVSKASVDHLIQIRGIGEEKAKKLIEGAIEFVETQQAEAEADDEAADESAAEAAAEAAAGAADESVAGAADEAVAEAADESVAEAADESVAEAADESVDEAAAGAADGAADEAADESAAGAADESAAGEPDANPEDQNSESDDAKGQNAQTEEINLEADEARASTGTVDTSADEIPESETSDESEVNKTG
ncbi:MAG: transcription termination/antitermination protein NusA [Deltaproteobacteria bacterium]|jgi:N utilization substance protein A|nr:transcription termination/antitermination protein NusA [Deltaproteobacteria bacterium]